jgi:ribosomal protein S8
MDKKDITFSKHLFWDIDEEELDMEKHKAFIVERVLDYGFINDWNTIKKYYSLDELGKIAMRLRCLSKKSLSFITVVTNTKKEDYRCYKLAQYLPKHWNF